MKIILRADASATIGTGHVMRCLALAGELRARHHDVHLFCGDRPDRPVPWKSYAEQLGVTVVPISPETPARPCRSRTRPRHAHFLQWPWEADAAIVQRVIEQDGRHPDWLIVDHYALDARWESAVRPLTRKLMVIDDLADREHACDLLLDQNRLAPGNPYARLVPAHCTVLLGPRFALLRPEFQETPSRGRPNDQIRRLLIFFGGVDQKAVTRKALEAVRRLPLNDLQIDVVLGSVHPAVEAVRDLAQRMDRVQIHVQVNDMAALMRQADLMLGAAGTTTWERCATGLPALILSVAGNQEAIAKSVAKEGLAVYLGKAEEVSVETICRELQHALSHSEALHQMGQRAAAWVDGHGSRRIADYLTGETAKEYNGEHTAARSCTA